MTSRLVIQKAVADLEIGKSGHCVPWAVHLVRQTIVTGRWWKKTEEKEFFEIRGDYTVYPVPGGTVDTMITRTQDGIEVTFTRVWKMRPDNTAYPSDWRPLPAILTELKIENESYIRV